jgi:predicted signal transduction protein with EAL and GGDEF domain
VVPARQRLEAGDPAAGYAVKSSRRGAFRFFDRAMSEGLEERREIEAELRSEGGIGPRTGWFQRVSASKPAIRPPARATEGWQ